MWWGWIGHMPSSIREELESWNTKYYKAKITLEKWEVFSRFLEV